MTANKIRWLGHASIRIEGEKVIYIDPWRLRADRPKSDIILITHSHHDHCSKKDVAMIARDDTLILAPPDCADALPSGFRPVLPDQTITAGTVVIRTVPAYNIGKSFHPRANAWVGYFIEMGGESIYFTGDTDYIPEMDTIAPDILIVPVGGTYTMTSGEAARVANRMKPRLAIPVHFGSAVGTRLDADVFKKLAEVPVEILPEDR
ncbi:MAG: MBL fold metallo-hydrolase [PVC group bacterium]